MSEVKYKTRRVCFEVLRRIAVDKAYSNLESANLYNNYGLSINDRRFVKTLVFGVLERQLLLDYIIALFVNKKPDIETRLLLRIGLQQIMFMEVPPSAACDETVDVAKNVLDKSRAGFVNAVLRNICRNEKKVRDAVEKAEGYIKYSVSESIYGLLKEQYGETAEDILKSFYDKKTLFLRVNTLKTTAEELCDKLGSEGAEAVKVSDGTIEIIKGGGTAVRMIDGGEFFIQGLGSQYAVESLCATGGQTVIDVCASPGGKSLGAAIDMKNRGTVISFDIHKNKLSLIEKSAHILGIDIIKTSAFDSRGVCDEYIGAADRVICDVPCSGLGVISSKPEIRYKNVSDFTGLYDTQKQIIASGSKYLKKGGVMVYSTCTLKKYENEEIVRGFLRDHSGFEIAFEKTFLPYERAGEGFYIAKIIKV